jgi:hypothetical protein
MSTVKEILTAMDKLTREKLRMDSVGLDASPA